MAEFEAQKLTKEEYPQWDEFVTHSKSGTIFQSTAWLRQFELPLDVFTVRNKQGDIFGGFAFVKFKRFGVLGVHSLPCTAVLAPILQTPSKNSSPNFGNDLSVPTTILLKSLPKLGHINMFFPPGHTDLLPYHSLDFQLFVRCTHEVRGQPEDIRTNAAKSVRQYLNTLYAKVHAHELVVSVDAESDKVLAHLDAAGKQKGFEANVEICRKLFPNQKLEGHWIAIKVQDRYGDLLAGCILVYDSSRAYNVINIATNKGEGSFKNANILCIYEAMRYSLEKGLVFDFEGSMIPGVAAFYKKMGGVQVPVYHIQRSCSLRYSVLRAVKQISREVSYF